MALSIQIASDFVCPYCYVLEALLERLQGEGLAIEAEYLPFELTEPPEPRVDTARDPERRARYARELAPLCRELGLPGRLPPGVSPRPYTRMAFQGLYLARELGREAAYVRRVFRGYFEEERDIGDLETLLALAGEAGVDPRALREALEDGRYAAGEREAVRRARETLGVRVVPTLFLNGRRLEGAVRSLEDLRAWLLEEES